MLNNTKTQSRPKLLFLVPAISQTHKSLENSQDFLSRPRPRPGLYFFVLEAPRDQDFGLEDYITGESIKLSTKETTQPIHHFVQNCTKCIENYCFKHKKPRRLQGGVAPDPAGGFCPWTSAGAPPPDTHYRLALPRSPWVCVKLE